MSSPAIGHSLIPPPFTDDYVAASSAYPSPRASGGITGAAVILLAFAGCAAATTNVERPITAEVRGADSLASGPTFLLWEVAERAAVTPSVAQSVRDLREASGLTWEQLARIFGVSRRAVHNWANGGRMTVRHAEILSHISRLVADLPASDPASRRDLLLAPGRGGRSMFDAFRAIYSRDEPSISGSPLSPAELLGVYGRDG